MQTYTIEIDETQRHILEMALRALAAKSSRPSEPLSLLVDMFMDLPTQEADQPKITHGFC